LTFFFFLDYQLLARVLWLLTLEDPEGQLLQAFDTVIERVPVWFWVVFIPQLLNTLSRPETRPEAKQVCFFLFFFFSFFFQISIILEIK